MDWLTFISKLVEFLAWPVVTVVIGLAYQERLGVLIPILKRIKAGPLEAEFEREVKAVAAEAAEAVPLAEPTTPTNFAVESATTVIKSMRNARSDPTGAIIEGWGLLDGELFRLLHQLDLNSDPLLSSRKVLGEALLHLPSTIAKSVRDLQVLRNRVAHAEVTPSVESAQEYLVAVQAVNESINKYRQTLPNYSPNIPLPGQVK